jgi:hypothetical protein
VHAVLQQLMQHVVTDHTSIAGSKLAYAELTKSTPCTLLYRCADHRGRAPLPTSAPNSPARSAAAAAAAAEPARAKQVIKPVRQAQLLARLRQQVAAASGAAPLPLLPPLGYRLDGFSTAPALSFSAVQAQVQQHQQQPEQESDAQLLQPFQACYAAPESLDQECTGLTEGSATWVMQLPASSALLTVHSGFSDGMLLAVLVVLL